MLMRTPTCCRPHRPSSSLKRNALSVTFLRNVADVAGEICLLLPLGFLAIGGPTLGCLDNPKFQDLKSLLLWGPLSLGTEQNARDGSCSVCAACLAACAAAAGSDMLPLVRSVLFFRCLWQRGCLWDLEQFCGICHGEEGKRVEEKIKKFKTVSHRDLIV